MTARMPRSRRKHSEAPAIRRDPLKGSLPVSGKLQHPAPETTPESALGKTGIMLNRAMLNLALVMAPDAGSTHLNGGNQLYGLVLMIAM